MSNCCTNAIAYSKPNTRPDTANLSPDAFTADALSNTTDASATNGVTWARGLLWNARCCRV